LDGRYALPCLTPIGAVVQPCGAKNLKSHFAGKNTIAKCQNLHFQVCHFAMPPKFV